jgi:hypothetical protein
VVALAAALTAALATRGQLNRLREDNRKLSERCLVLESANVELEGKEAALSKRLKNAEERCGKVEARLKSDEQIRELAARAAREELAKSRTATRAGGKRGRDPLAGARGVAEKRGAEIAEIREKVKNKEMTPEEGRKAMTAKIQDGLKAVMGKDAVERMEKARLEREKNMTPEQKKKAENTRAAIIDGIGEWMEVQKKVREGKMTREQARKLLQEKWRARAEALRKAREDAAKPPETKEEF